MAEGSGIAGLGKSRVVDLSDSTFHGLVMEAKYAAVLFWSGSCMPCRMMMLVFDELSLSRKDVLFGRVNVGGGSLAQRLNVFSVPTILLFREGKRVARVVGVKQLEVLSEIIGKYLSEAPPPDGPYADHS